MTTSVIGWHGRNLADHLKLRDDAAKNGYRFLSLSLYGPTNAPVYAAVMIKRPNVVAQRDWPSMTAAQFQQTFDDQAKLGYGPVMIATTGTASNPLFAAVFQPQNPIALTRHRLTAGKVDDTDVNTIQGMNRQARIDGLVPHWVASYGDSSDRRFAAVWLPNKDNAVWNADGVLESVSDYQGRADAQNAGWCRPSFVTLNGDNEYLSVFADNQVGHWEARHNLTPDQYQKEWDNWVPKGYLPVCVQAAGGGANTARFAAIFAKQETVVARQWTVTGPVANDAIDNQIKSFMESQPPLRQAALAIVKGTKLVYARGYTLAEPGWPITQPTTLFRIASVSKNVTALGIFQLIEKGDLGLTDKMQDILKLKTPAGGAPADSRFKDITVQHLLEHTSGLNTWKFNNDIAVRDAFKAAQPGKTWNLPVSAEMVDSYIASLPLDIAANQKPGDAQAYNNCGHYLLARILKAKRGTATPIDALQKYLFDPLKITRIRRGRTLVTAQASDETRYGASVIGKDDETRLNIPALASVMSNDQPLIPRGYGEEQYENKEGSGGLSAAVTDLARLLTLWITPNDSPVLKRATLTGMFTKALANQARFAGMKGERAGYGFDAMSHSSGDNYYGQKGGDLVTSQNVLQFNGEWGFVLHLASHLVAPTPKWYPDYPDVMKIAKAASWGSGDLFSNFQLATF